MKHMVTLLLAAALALTGLAPFAAAQVRVQVQTGNTPTHGGIPAVVLDLFRTSLETGLDLPTGSSALTALPELHIRALKSPSLKGEVLSALSLENQIKMAAIVHKLQHLETAPKTGSAVSPKQVRAPPSGTQSTAKQRADARTILRSIDKALSDINLEDLKDEAAAKAAMGRIFDGLLERSRAQNPAAEDVAGAATQDRAKSGLLSSGTLAEKSGPAKKPVPLPKQAPKKPRPLPLITFGLIAVNVLIHVLSSMELLSTAGWGVVPYTLQWGFEQGGFIGLLGESWTLISSTFVHANWAHLWGNMAGLAIIGTIVERGLGHWKTLGAFLASSTLAGAIWAAANWGLAVGSVGASAGVMGLAGVFVVLVWLRYRHIKEETRWQSFGIFLLGWLASIVLLQFGGDIWALLLQLGQTLGQPWGKIDNVNHFAHVIGLLVGLIAARFWLRRPNVAGGQAPGKISPWMS